MTRRRNILAAALIALSAGSILATLLYARHLRGEGRRLALATELGERLGMSVSIDAIEPLSFSHSALHDLRVRLEPDGVEVFSCESAVWTGAGDGSRNELELRNGRLIVGAADWTGLQYRQMIRGGVGHEFDKLHLAEIRLDNIDLTFLHPAATLSAENASGIIFFDEMGVGNGSVGCRGINGTVVAEPVHVSFRFTPGASWRFHEVRLTAPSVPLAALGVDRLLGRRVAAGSFRGEAVYKPDDAGAFEFSGSVKDADLTEIAGDLFGPPVGGRVNVDVASARFVNRICERIELHGRLAELRIPVELFGTTGAAVTADLDIEHLRWNRGRLEDFRLRGVFDGLPIDAVLSPFGVGRSTGIIRAKINSIRIHDDEVRSAELIVDVQPPSDGPGRLDRSLIARLARDALGIGIVLPESVEYVRLSARLIVEHDELRVLGSHGPDDATILTIRLMGQEWDIIKQPEKPFPLPDLLRLARSEAKGIDWRSVMDWLRSKKKPDN